MSYHGAGQIDRTSHVGQLILALNRTWTGDDADSVAAYPISARKYDGAFVLQFVAGQMKRPLYDVENRCGERHPPPLVGRGTLQIAWQPEEYLLLMPGNVDLL